MENFVQKQNQPQHISPKLGVNKGPCVPRESLTAGKVDPYFAAREKAADMTKRKLETIDEDCYYCLGWAMCSFFLLV